MKKVKQSGKKISKDKQHGSIVFARRATDEEVLWAVNFLRIMGNIGNRALKDHREYCHAEFERGRKPLPFTAWFRMKGS